MSVSEADCAASESYNFTTSQDWFTHNIATWEPYINVLLSSLPAGRAPRALEVGTWEGRSAVYILNKICNTADSLLVCVDHFDLLRTVAGRERHDKVVHNLTLTGSPFRILDEFSVPGLMTLLKEEALANYDSGFDFVYLDGSHEADDTFLDAELAWRLTRSGGLLIFDDYGWDREPASSMHHPSRGIEAFITLHKGQFELLHKEYQVILRKTVEMRIGFLHKSVSSHTSDLLKDFEYGINVALCIDSSYAMAGAVVLRSAIDTTAGRMTFYIVDCGLQSEEKHKLEASIPQARTDEVTLVFLSLPHGSRGIREPTWAKIDMIIHPSFLPVERVLYLDADILVRRDLKGIWSTDMGKCAIGATRDIGYPLGHPGLSEVERCRPYFNAGVLLINLSLSRQRHPEMRNALAARQETAYKDQDFLNAFFSGDLYELDIAWNASGLGTYASWSSADRDNTWPQGLATLLLDPAIVHFTGPLHPSMSNVLNESLQPWVSKPWGYSGAPGNPFTEHWWEVLEKTTWKGTRQDKTFKESLIRVKKAIVEDGLVEFERRISIQ
ncbi:glycosyltransferase family 8 protein [Hysterangium stoloniferum]|nr:glycosyltransferase family 8 protein [Hysterangium stoloniferum]